MKIPLRCFLPTIKILVFASVMFLGSYINAEELKNGDLIFLISGESQFSKAISHSTFRSDSLDFDHVGIIEKDYEGGIDVIEANPQKGVQKVHFEEFTKYKKDENYKQNFVIKRLTIPINYEEVLASANNRIGEEYDWWYMPDNGKTYCSELVYDCYVDSSGNHIFEAEPMNFRSSDGTIHDFWINLFEQINSPIPEGIQGTNPNSLSRSPLLITVIYP